MVSLLRCLRDAGVAIYIVSAREDTDAMVTRTMKSLADAGVDESYYRRMYLMPSNLRSRDAARFKYECRLHIARHRYVALNVGDRTGDFFTGHVPSAITTHAARVLLFVHPLERCACLKL